MNDDTQYPAGRMPRPDLAGVLTYVACCVLAAGVYLILAMAWS